MNKNVEIGNPQIINHTNTDKYNDDINDAFNYVEDLYNSKRAQRRMKIANRYALNHGADSSFLDFTPTKTIDIVPGQGSGFDSKRNNIFIGIDDTRANPYDITSHEAAHSRNLFNTKDKSISNFDRYVARSSNIPIKEDSPYYGNNYDYISNKYKK
jgi:hypothetical protein